MKAISLHHPHAMLAVLGEKRFETRGLTTNHRGPLAICATKNRKWIELACFWYFREALARHGIRPEHLESSLGCVVGVVSVRSSYSTATWLREHCRRSFAPDWLAQEIMFGDFGPHRSAWQLENPKRLETPIAVKGKQGFFYLPHDVDQAVSAQL